MAIQINGTTVINNSRQLENIDTLKLAGTNIDVSNATTSINYINPPQGTSAANGATSGGLYIRAGGIWYYRLSQNANWGGVTLVCSKSDSSGNNVDTTLASIVDGDTMVVWINSSNYGIYQVNDSSIYNSVYARFFDVNLVSGVGNFAVANNGALQLKVGFSGISTTLTKTNPTATRTITLPDASGTVALTGDISPSTTYGAVGTYIAAYPGSGAGTTSVGDTISGSNLYRDGSSSDVRHDMNRNITAGSLTSLSLSGTWRAMSSSYNTISSFAKPSVLFIRIS